MKTIKFFRYLLESIVIIIFFIVFKILGRRISTFISGKIFCFLGPFFRSKKIISKNLIKAFPKISDKEIKVNMNQMWNYYGKIFAEYPFLKNFRNGDLNSFIEINGKNYLEIIKKEKKSVVFVSGHFNNFELMAMQIEKMGIELSAIYRPLNNTFLNKIMENIRTKYICKNQIKKGRAGTRQILKDLKKGNSVALMIDQRVREGSKVKFFGNLATTTSIPAQLIKKYKCELVPIYIERKDKYYFKMHISKPIKISSQKNTEDITLFLNTILEKMILKNIDQWIWTHNRWKK